MKKIILILSAAVLFAACKQKNLTNAASLQEQLDSIKQAQQGVPVETYKTRTVTQPAYRTRTVYRSYPAQTTVVKKSGMRRSTKNALIGAGVGAVGGALIGGDHHRVKGAVIGGVLGAGAGYIYGKHREKKYGRY
jgi:hypothetical protein